MLVVRLAEAGLLEPNLTLLVELIAFLIMVFVLGRYAYPRIINAAEDRQRALTQQLEEAEKSRQEADQRLQEADERLRQASRQAQEIIDRASRAGEEVRTEMRARGEQEAGRIVERARRDIEGERNQALQALRVQVADLVVGATRKVVGESLDVQRHQRLIDEAVQQVGVEANGQREG